MPKTKVYIAENVFVSLCSQGQALRKAWCDALEARAEPDVIYTAMRAYFTHRNGSPSGNGANAHPCLDCSYWMQEN